MWRKKTKKSKFKKDLPLIGRLSRGALRACIAAVLFGSIGVWAQVISHAASPNGVQFVIFCATNACSGSTAQLQSNALTVQNFYKSQLGSTFNIVSDSTIIYGTHPASWYVNNKPANGATGNGAVIANIMQDTGLGGYNSSVPYGGSTKTVMMLGFKAFNGLCGLTEDYWTGSAVSQDLGGNLSVYDPFSCPPVNSGSAPEVMAHELGHAFGLDPYHYTAAYNCTYNGVTTYTTAAHVCSPTLMNAYGCPNNSIYGCNIEQPEVNYLEGSWIPWFPLGALPSNDGYWLTASDGGVFAINEPFYGSEGGKVLNKPVVGMAADPATGGYWLVAADGGIFSFNAPFYGSMGGHALNQPVVGMASTKDGGGYWLVAADGGIFTFGDAPFYGSEGGKVLNKPVVGMAANPATGGYWLVAADGGIFTFNTPFYGSEGGKTLNKPIVGMASTKDGGGYWLVAADGGIFTFGDAPYLGSVPGDGIAVSNVVGISQMQDGGYVVAASDGHTYWFSPGGNHGFRPAMPLNKPIVGVASH